MSNEIDFSCIDNLSEKLKELGKKGARIESEALTKGAEVILEDMKRTTAFDDRTKKLREGLKIDKVRTSKGIKSVKIGIQKDDNSEIFYGKFIEFGTKQGSKSIVAKPFMRPAFENKREEAKAVTINIIKEALKWILAS